MEHPKNENRGCCLCPLLEADLEKATEANEDLLSVIADIRQASGVGDIPMLSDLAETIGRKLALLQEVARMAEGFYLATVEWNDAVERLIGRQPKTGISISELKRVLDTARDGGALDEPIDANKMVEGE